MGRKSTKENKNVYQEARDNLGWSREKAADEIMKIENGRYSYLLDMPERNIVSNIINKFSMSKNTF